MLRKIFTFLSSMKLAVILLALLIVLSVLATLIPQNHAPEYYKTRYSAPAAKLISAAGFDRFFRSPLFFAAAGLFFINLSACTVRRLAGRTKSKARKRFGPDIIHIAVLLLMITGILSIFLVRQVRVIARPGDIMEFLGGLSIRITETRREEYADGRPKDWYTHAEIINGDGAVIRGQVIEVNKPLRIGGYKIFQYSFSSEEAEISQTGLLVQSNPLFPVILAVLLLFVCGMALTFIQKLGDRRT